ncbi:hypothetical protein VFPPC_18445 [Pochonia chlamydosporia 170]|uniref:Uncharacterized protein n=1 Tax=Pochonia chlamydosporia 170 TaxID=1380566 RepID=A0A219AQ74_METCM|nr:hypothetical protein VFPPC_18445 [Pochonia chlamydosporia 170]OWT42474.1 hypothetical protein VFPPC_18445 [Pochonia chlamydosporia 170]
MPTQGADRRYQIQFNSIQFDSSRFRTSGTKIFRSQVFRFCVLGRLELYIIKSDTPTVLYSALGQQRPTISRMLQGYGAVALPVQHDGTRSLQQASASKIGYLTLIATASNVRV